MKMEDLDDVVFRPGAKTWVLHGFVTLLLLLSSLFWFFDPGPWWIRALGAGILVYWAYVLVGVGRSRIELHDETIEIHGLAYRLPSRQQAGWLYGILFVFILADLFALFLGPLPRVYHQARVVVSLVWLGAYFIKLLQNLPSGRHSILYTAIETLPWEAEMAPYPSVVSQKSLFLGLKGEKEPFLLPPWLKADDRAEFAGRVSARVKLARRLAEAEPAAAEAPGQAPTS